ncbi:MAG: hypothetical protein ASUL_06573 [Candidatus Aramenus sulfurataquae]|uniref:7-cyano-7-deazaguanine synthase n=1 Tax=Candidatus Aramenus sulfurataquae TaxID=1326980 RepID=W7KWW5_9CREN|nr:MAG: hypothetical protein ASUL_06573 [Candidatus Aramenus sulfurataquae]
MRSLLLISGGLDSSAAAYYFKDKLMDCLYVNYGQRSNAMQLKSAKEICSELGKKLIYVNIKDMGKHFYDADWLRPHEPIRHRNVILLSFALVFAKERGYDEVIFPTVSDECVYETNKPKILEEMRRLGEILGVKLNMPFLHMSKPMVLKLGVMSGLDPSKTYSCILGKKYHCGKCSQCEMRKMAFREVKIADPTKYYS